MDRGSLGPALALATFAAALLLVACIGDRRSPAECISEFLSHSGPPDTLIDPLLTCPRNVAPVLIQQFPTFSLATQRLALNYFGLSHSVEAKSLLVEAALAGNSDFVRGDALVSLAELDREPARELAKQVAHEPGYLGECARDVLTGKRLEKRSHLKAWLGYHD